MNNSSHKDALLGRFTGPVREVFKGNPDVCGAYRSLGQKLLGYLKNTLGTSGIEVGMRSLLLPNGVRIGARVDGVNHILYVNAENLVPGWIKEFPLWIETGMINLVNLSDGSVPITRSFIYYSTHQYAALELKFPKWLDEILIAINEQDVVVRIREGEVRIPHAPTHASYPDQSYIDSLGFQTLQWIDEHGVLRTEYTKTQACTPHPGYATGRLKLYLQALLGSVKHTDFVLDTPGKTNPWYVKVIETCRLIMGDYWSGINGSIAFNWDFSRGLFVSEDYRYWLVSIIDRGLLVQPLVIPRLSAIVRRRFRKDFDDLSVLERSKVEAYILGFCTDFGEPIVVADNLLASVKGSPLHEGWKFNYRGTEAQIVTKEVIWEEYEESYRIKYHTFRRYKISLTYDKNNKENPFSASLSKQEEVNATPEEKCLRPYRKPESGGHFLEWEDWHEWLIGPTRGYSAWIEYDAPLYCWYERNTADEEQFITVRDIVKWPDEILDDVNAEFEAYVALGGPFNVCGVGSARVQNVVFADQVGAKRGYYLKAETPETSIIHPDLLDPSIFYTTSIELVDGRIDTVAKTTQNWRAESNFEGYSNLGFYTGTFQCDGTLASLNPEMGGGLWVDVTTHHGTYESLRYTRSGDVRLGFVLVFPYHDGESVYIQRNQYTAGPSYFRHSYANIDLDWAGVATFADGHTAHQEVNPAFMLTQAESAVDAAIYDPLYADYPEHSPDSFVVEYPAGIFYATYACFWSEEADHRRFYYASAKTSTLLFDETAIKRGEQYWYNPHFISAPWWYPPDGIDPYLCFGKHNWYVNIDQLEFWPWFDFPVYLNESFNAKALTLQQWGPFVDKVQMPTDPIYYATDSLLLFHNGKDIRNFSTVFTGWA